MQDSEYKIGTIDPAEIIARFCPVNSKAYRILERHGRRVADKSLRVAAAVPHLKPDPAFIEEAAILHDIGMVGVDAPKLGFWGNSPQICHGLIGRVMLAELGLPRHGLVCERHVGVGLSAADIERNGFPLPVRDMRPVSTDEIIIAYADKFFSKHPDDLEREKSIEEVIEHISRYGGSAVATFMDWAGRFGEARPG